MGKIMLDMYEEARKLGGLKAQIRLAVLTKISSVKAKDVTDTPEQLNIFRQSMDIIRNECRESVTH